MEKLKEANRSLTECLKNNGGDLANLNSKLDKDRERRWMVMEELEQLRFNSTQLKDLLKKQRQISELHARKITVLRGDLKSYTDIAINEEKYWIDANLMVEIRDKYVEEKTQIAYTKSYEGDSLPGVPVDTTSQIDPPIYSKNPCVLYPGFLCLIQQE